ncbi:unnamed protein product [Cuscuta epithymum]|uniref:Uncharacterized protein n=1 Tax=Cuscuta epithymum TaxID=186058 RepID=A0AAV0DSD8_9ASTE|nr:unnamed protein product [Cuscuta epithymum]
MVGEGRSTSRPRDWDEPCMWSPLRGMQKVEGGRPSPQRCQTLLRIAWRYFQVQGLSLLGRAAFHPNCFKQTLENALENPPTEMQDRSADEWIKLCDHFSSEKFLKSSTANTSNRSKKKHNHRTGSRPIAYIVEEMTAVIITTSVPLRLGREKVTRLLRKVGLRG